MKDKLDAEKMGEIWDKNADLWVKLSKDGYDRYGDLLSTPSFFKILLPINNLKGLDVGCGDGQKTNKLASLGANMIGIDISEQFIKHAKQESGHQVQYFVKDAANLSLESNQFDFAVAFNSLMGIPNLKKTLEEVYRVLKSGGFFQFSITHPCFWRQILTWSYDKKGEKTGLMCNDYFSPQKRAIGKWMFDGVDDKTIKQNLKFETPLYKRTLSEWINSISKVGFVIEKSYEPQINKSVVVKYPELDGARIVPYFWIVRCRKP